MVGKTIITWGSFPETSPSLQFLSSADKKYPPSHVPDAPSTPRPPESYGTEEVAEVGFIEGVQNFWTFIEDVRKNGLSHAIYGDSFFNVMVNFFKELMHDIGVFLLANGDLFFLAPAMFLMFMTFLGGKNKYTKWIIPLWFAYFVTSVFHKILE
jgi:hypothetical protein